jgi:site-specific recombinase XerD
MPKITNEFYREFLDKGIIKTLGEEEIKKVLLNIKGKNVKEGRALIIALYYTGARPNEVLKALAKDVEKKGSYITIKLQGSKNGLPRTIYLKGKSELPKELYNFSLGIFPEMYLFHNFRSKRIRTHLTKKGDKREYTIVSDKLYYWVKKWFENVQDISAYFLRHNRFSKLSESGITPEQIRILKGAKTFESVTPYLHMSTDISKKIARKMN